jgi:hypothetical protein
MIPARRERKCRDGMVSMAGVHHGVAPLQVLAVIET